MWDSLSCGGPSGPMLFFQIKANWNKSIGPEGPPTRAWATARPGSTSPGAVIETMA
ncbi:DUF6053 domain-containing protein [Lysobacter enzymogenes]|uniref:DUF6053 domain-containing protein n=1 Tax=Lysobacter enzymogenes TaxID=69 RepID=UPI0033978AAF